MSSVLLDTPRTQPPPYVPAAMTELFTRLQAADLRYCVWKGIARLESALLGERDLDVLVQRRYVAAAGEILAASGFARFPAIPSRASGAMEDHFAFDSSSGQLLHVHLHCEMLLTKAGLHWYRLPWEELALSTRVFRDEPGVFVADPHLELVGFVMRAAIGVRATAAVEPGRPAFRGAALEELEWLRARTSRERVLQVALPLTGPAAALRLVAMLDTGRATLRDLIAFRGAATPPLHEFRVGGTVHAVARQLEDRGRRRWQPFATRFLAAAVPLRRTLSAPGPVIAFLGADGSGKSTVVAEVTRWLSRKIDVLPLYFGSGNGPVSLLRLPLRLLDAVRRPGGSSASDAAKAPGVAGGGTTAMETSSRAVDLLRAIRRGWWALAVAREKIHRFAQLRRARARGMVVVCDRFPQDQILGYNDGPLLAAWHAHSSVARRWAARRELAAYRTAVASPPDLVIKLHVSPDVARRRKPSTPLETIRRKRDAVRDIQFAPHVRVVEIDADQPAERVLLEAKRAVWELISRGAR